MTHVFSRTSRLLVGNYRRVIIDFYKRNRHNSYNNLPVFKNTLKDWELEKYKSYVDYIISCCVNAEVGYPPDGRDHLRKFLRYTLPSNDQDTGPLVVSTYKHFADPKRKTPKDMHLAYTMGWVHDMIIRSYQIADDVLDSSETRANKPCWYKVEDVGLTAINDSMVIGAAVLMLTRNHLLGHPSLDRILELTHDTKLKISLGQLLDLNGDLDVFTMDRYKILARYKGTAGAIIDPITRGMYLAEVFDASLHAKIKSVLVMLGEYFTAQNDMLDCYGNSTVTGKYGTDMVKGKCTWLSVKALQDANSSQRKIFKEHYGKFSSESQDAIYRLYNDLKILEKFLAYEEDSYRKIRTTINNTLSDTKVKEYLYKMSDSLFGKTV